MQTSKMPYFSNGRSFIFLHAIFGFFICSYKKKFLFLGKQKSMLMFPLVEWTVGTLQGIIFFAVIFILAIWVIWIIAKAGKKK